MIELIFKPGKVISKPKERPVRFSDDRGYYWKGELIDKYKEQAKAKIRERVNNDKENKLIEEKKFLRKEYEKSKEITKKIEEAKEEYYLRMNIESNKLKIERLKLELEKTKNELYELIHSRRPHNARISKINQ